VYLGRPEPPSDVRVLSCRAGFVELRWITTDGNGSPITEYIVYYTDSSSDAPDQLVIAALLQPTGQQVVIFHFIKIYNI